MRLTIESRKRLVVGDEDDGAGVTSDVAFEPELGIDIEVVGRLVEQQHLGFAQQQLRERDAHLPTAGELAGVALEVGVFEAEAGEHLFDARLHLAHIVVVEVELDFAVNFEGVRVFVARGVERSELLGCGFELRLQREGVLEGGLGFREEGAAADVDALLGQVADVDVFRLIDVAAVGRGQAGDDLHQGRFAGAVWPGEADAVLGAHREGEVLVQDPPDELDGDPFNG